MQYICNTIEAEVALAVEADEVRTVEGVNDGDEDAINDNLDDELYDVSDDLINRPLSLCHGLQSPALFFLVPFLHLPVHLGSL